MDEWKKPDIGRYNLSIVIVCLVLVLFGWLYYDHRRNKPIYESTDVILDTIEVRVDDAGKRTDAIKDRVGKAEESVKQSANKIAGSREDADAIAEGLAGCEARLDSIIQRHGRIKNIITDLENANK